MQALELSQAACRFRHGPIPAEAGIGLRFQHHESFLADRPNVAWLEVHTENYMGGGPAVAILEKIRQNYPLSLHGVGLSLGTVGALDREHLERISKVIRRVEPSLVSEHVSWSVANSTYAADLLPLPMTHEALDVLSRHVNEAQDYLGRQLLLENPSTYIQYAHSEIPEWQFLNELVATTGCGLLCDVNNIFVSCCNHGWDPIVYLKNLPTSAIGEIHLAGHSIRRFNGRDIRIDDHGSEISPEVWALFECAVQRFGPTPTLIEWDNDIPELDVLTRQAHLAGAILNRHNNVSDD